MSKKSKTAPAADSPLKGDSVVLMHGILRDHKVMRKMQKHFENLGCRVLNVDYPSTKKPIADLAEGLLPQISQFNAAAADKRIHFVGHSLGGLVTRAFLAAHKPENLGRVVTIGSPHGGSEVADVFKNVGVYRKVFGYAGQELVTKRNDDVTLGKVDFEIGTIAGDRTLYPLTSLLLLKGKNDGRVSSHATHVTGEGDHITVHVSHTRLPKNAATIRQAAHFLAQGKFKR